MWFDSHLSKKKEKEKEKKGFIVIEHGSTGPTNVFSF